MNVEVVVGMKVGVEWGLRGRVGVRLAVLRKVIVEVFSCIFRLVLGL